MTFIQTKSSFSWYKYVGFRYLLSVYNASLTGLISRIAMASLIVAVSMLILVMSVMNGFEKELENRILAFIPHLTLELEGNQHIYETSLSSLYALPGVSSVYPFSRQEVLLNNGVSSFPVLLIGLDRNMVEHSPAFLSLLGKARWQTFFLTPGAILLSDKVADNLVVDEGDSLLVISPKSSNRSSGLSTTMTDHTYLGRFHTGTELDKGMAFINLPPVRTDVHSVLHFRIDLDNVYQAGVIAKKLEERFPGGKVTSWMESQGGLYEAIRLSRNLVALLLLLIIFVAVFNVITTLMLLVKEKASSIAILKTMGARRVDLMMIFMIQGGGIGLLGTLLGVMLGIGLSLSVSPIVKMLEMALGFQFLDSSVYPIDFLPSDIHFLDVILIAATAITMSIIGAVYPAWVAARTAPAKILRDE